MGGKSAGSTLQWLVEALTFHSGPQQSRPRAKAEVQGWGWDRVSTGWAGRAEGRFQPRPLKNAKGHPEENKFRCQIQRATGGLRVGGDPGGPGMEWEQARPEMSGLQCLHRTSEVPAVRVWLAQKLRTRIDTLYVIIVPLSCSLKPSATR